MASRSEWLERGQRGRKLQYSTWKDAATFSGGPLNQIKSIQTGHSEPLLGLIISVTGDDQVLASAR